MSRRALRVGVLIGESLVEEKLLDASQPITLGQSLRCTLSVPVDGVPREHVLFAIDDGRFVLHVADRMTVRLSHGAPGAPLERGARGKLQIGDATILFQEVAAPAPVPRPQLPLAIRGTLLDRVDRRLAAIIGGSLAVHVAIAAWAWSNDVEQPARDFPISAHFQETRIDLADPRLEAPATTPGPGAATPIAPQHIAPPIAQLPPRTITPTAPPKLGTDDALQLASILSGDETARTGVGGMSAHRPGSNLQAELDELQNSHHEITIGDDGRGPRTTDTRIDPTNHLVPLDNPQRTTTLEAPKEHKDGRVKLEGGRSDDKTTLTPQAVLDIINSDYLPGLQRCYRKGLSLDAELSGKITLSLTVDERGHVTEPSASGTDAQVDHCIQTLMGAWRFPIPHDKAGEPTDATFHIALALRPS